MLPVKSTYDPFHSSPSCCVWQATSLWKEEPRKNPHGRWFMENPLQNQRMLINFQDLNKCPLTCRELAASDTLEILAERSVWGLSSIPFENVTFFRNISFRNTYHLSFNSQFHINQKKKHVVFGNLATISSPIPHPPASSKGVGVFTPFCLKVKPMEKPMKTRFFVSPIIWGFPKIPNNYWFSY